MAKSSKVDKREEEEEEQREAPIHGDILESIFSHVPLVDLVSASHVSKPWSRAVSSSLRNINKQLTPWLVVHRQKNTRAQPVIFTRAYDPRSRVWIDLTQTDRVEVDFFFVLRSSPSSNLLYSLTSNSFSFSSDPLHRKWRHGSGPITPRRDPVVALVGRHLVVAGGVCDLVVVDELNLLSSVEIYDIQSRAWSSGASMPLSLSESASSTWLSAAASDDKLFVTERSSAVTHAFDPEANTWHGPHDLRPDPDMLRCEIATINGRLILIGLIGDCEGLKCVRLYEVDCESYACKMFDEMPERLVERLRSNAVDEEWSLNVCASENVMYMWNPSHVEEIFACEVDEGGCSWWSVRNEDAEDRSWSERFVMTCSKVGIDDVCRAVRLENVRFEVVGKTR